MHLADAFIQSDLHCIQVTVFFCFFLHFYQLLLSLGIEPMILALLAPCSTSWATGKLKARKKFFFTRHFSFTWNFVSFQDFCQKQANKMLCMASFWHLGAQRISLKDSYNRLHAVAPVLWFWLRRNWTCLRAGIVLPSCTFPAICSSADAHLNYRADGSQQCSG